MAVLSMTKTLYDVVGIGNAIVDYLAHVDDAFLVAHQMEKGAMQLVSAERSAALRANLLNARVCSGGSVANTMAGLADMGARCAYIGRVADDALGHIFSDDMRGIGVTYTTSPAQEGAPTASCVVCVTPDGQRTMNTHIGACAELSVDDIDESLIRSAKILYIEGYLWDAPDAKDAILHAMHCAKDAGVKIAFTLSDAFCVERHRTEFRELIAEHINILFANEQEMQSLYGVNIADELMRQLDIAVITRSESPATIYAAGQQYSIDAIKTHVVDTTGAGDLFAAGFLYGLTTHQSLENSARLGHRMAAHIISQLGARSSSSLSALVA
jgi:sugar/nucleoside kinase (ribokinase family)